MQTPSASLNIPPAEATIELLVEAPYVLPKCLHDQKFKHID